MEGTIPILGSYARNAFLQWAAGRSFVVTLVAQQAVPPLVGLAVWTTALPRAGYLTTYYVALLVVQLCTVSYENHTFSNRVYSGELADDLLRPCPVVLGPLGENLAIRCWHVIIGLPLLVALVVLLRVHVTWASALAAAPALLLAAALQFLYTFTLALSAFWTERVHGVVGLGSALVFLLGGAAAPIALLPAGLHAWGAALPFRAMSAFPVELAVGGLSPADALAGYGLQIGWIAVFSLGAWLLWRAGLRRYTAIGG